MSFSDPLAASTPGVSQPGLLPGTSVEVRTSFDRTWVRGFAIEAVLDGRYSLRRLSDGHVLPRPFSGADVREDRPPTWT